MIGNMNYKYDKECLILAGRKPKSFAERKLDKFKYYITLSGFYCRKYLILGFVLVRLVEPGVLFYLEPPKKPL